MSAAAAAHRRTKPDPLTIVAKLESRVVAVLEVCFDRDAPEDVVNAVDAIGAELLQLRNRLTPGE